MLTKDLLEKPIGLSTASKYTALNGVGYLWVGGSSFFGQVWHRRSSWNPLLLGMRAP